MTNFPVSPDLSALSEVMYNELAVITAFGQNFSQDQCLPAALSIQPRTYLHIGAEYLIADWNDEATNGFQTAEWISAYTNLYAYYTNFLIPNKIVMLQIFSWEVIAFRGTATRIQPQIIFKYLPFQK